MYHIYAYINLSYIIVNLACIISNHHCALFVIPIESMHSIITMYDMYVNVTVITFIYVIFYVI